MKLYRKYANGERKEWKHGFPQQPPRIYELAVEWAIERNKVLMVFATYETNTEEKKSLLSQRTSVILGEDGMTVVGIVPLDPTIGEKYRRTMSFNRQMWEEMKNVDQG